MSTVRVTSDGIVVDFSHNEVNTIETADDLQATVVGFIGAALAASGGVVGAVAGILAGAIALSIAVNKANFALNDQGFGVEVTESWPALVFGFFTLMGMKPLGPGFDQFLLHTGTPIAQNDAAANFTFAVGDYNRDGIPDLYCLKRTNTGTNRLEVHVLNGADNYQSFLLPTGCATSVLCEVERAQDASFLALTYAWRQQSRCSRHGR